MDNSILFAELLELVRFEGSRAVGYNCMGKTEMLIRLIPDFHTSHRKPKMRHTVHYSTMRFLISMQNKMLQGGKIHKI